MMISMDIYHLLENPTIADKTGNCQLEGCGPYLRMYRTDDSEDLTVDTRRRVDWNHFRRLQKYFENFAESSRECYAGVPRGSTQDKTCGSAVAMPLRGGRLRGGGPSSSLHHCIVRGLCDRSFARNGSAKSFSHREKANESRIS